MAEFRGGLKRAYARAMSIVGPAAFRAVPVNAMLGLELRAATPEGATVAMKPAASMSQEYGVLHGGLLATLADTAAVYALHPFLAAGERMTSIEFKINFLAAARADRGEVLATSSVVKRGRTVAVASVDVRQGEQLVASGLFTYIILPPAAARE
jgi:uncharacterized protein (TIGR00369 family)